MLGSTPWILPRLRVALALCALNALVGIPWIAGNWGISFSGIALLALWLALATLVIPIVRGRLPAPTCDWLLALGLILARCAALALIGDARAVGDAGIYPDLARGLIAGQGLAYYDPVTNVIFRALYPPAYPLLLAGVGALLPLTTAVIWAVNVAIDIVAMRLIVRLGTLTGAPSAGRGAAWLFAIWPAFALATPFANKEGLVIALVLAIAVVLVRQCQPDRYRRRDPALLGLASGLLMLTQPGLALFPAILALLLLPVARLPALAMLGLRALPFALLPLVPWWIRNVLLFGRFVPLTTTSGLGLWIGNNPDATGNWMPMPARYHGLPELLMSSRAAADALTWIAAHPLDWAALTMFKLFRAMGVEQFTLARMDQMIHRPSPATLAALCPLLQGALLVLLAVAAWLAVQSRRPAGSDIIIRIVAACALQILFVSLPFEFGERHRFFLMPFLFMMIATALTVHCRPTTLTPPNTDP